MDIASNPLSVVNPSRHIPLTKWENANKHIGITLAAIAAIALLVAAFGLVNWQGFLCISTPAGTFSASAAFWTMAGATVLCAAATVGAVISFIRYHGENSEGDDLLS